MTLPWSEKEIEDRLVALDREGVMKVFASLIFSRPDLLQHLPDLTKQLSGVTNLSEPSRQADVFNWIDASFPSSESTWPMLFRPNIKPIPPKADVEVRDAWAEHLAQAAKDNSECAELRSGRRVSGVAGAAIAGMPKGATPAIPTDVPKCLLQFSTAVYFAKESEDKEVSLDVMRLGSDECRVSCHFATQDGDGKAGLRYQAVSGVLVFEPGEAMKQVRVPIIDSRAWSSSLEFRVVLSQPEGDCSLGRYLYMCRVKVIDPDCFPTNKYAEQIRKYAWHSISMFGLLWEYFKFNYDSNDIVHRNTKRQLAVDQMVNLYFVFKLYVGKVIIDKILRVYDPAEPERGCAPGGYVFLGAILPCPTHEDPNHSSHYDFKMNLLMICALLIVIPQFFIHFLEYKEVFFKIGGTSRKTLQGNLVRKFLNYDDSARSQLGASDLVMAMTRDTQMLVSDGYMQVFPLAQNIGKLILMAALQLSFKAYWAMIPAVLYPFFLLSFLVYRNPLSTLSSLEQDHAQNDLCNHVTEIMTTYRLICDYVKRPFAVEKIEDKIGTFNKKMMANDAVSFNNKYMCKWLSLFCIGAWLVAGGNMILSGDSELGVFVTNLSIFKDVGEAWTIIFEVMLKMQGATPYLQKVVRYMNLPIDLETRMRLNRRRRAAGEEARQEARESLKNGSASSPDEKSKLVFAADLVPIAVKELAYSYDSPLLIHKRLEVAHTIHHSRIRKSQAGRGGLDEPLAEIGDHHGSIKNCSLSFPQGSFISLVGVPGHGKSTLMRLLGSQIVPNSGDLLIPPHLRALHISPKPTFFYDTLYANMTYGVSRDNNEDGSVDRVVAVLKELKVSNTLLQYLDPSKKDMFDVKAAWGELLSATQLGLLSLARAFIANPEVLVLHKPTVYFDDATAKRTYICLNDFIVGRGLCMDKDKVAYRRPRTCIITATRPQGVEVADEVFRVTPTCTVPVRVQQVTSEMLR